MEIQTKELLTWYDRNRRILPWREDPTAYHIWLSEIVLQQTRVETGKAYYCRFIDALPDVVSLAEVSEERLLKLWEGLGYYSRARNLHKAAKIIVSEYGGRMPSTAEELEKLPGIGPYSAAAIASIAYGEPVVSVDGNLLRIFARMTEYPGDIRTSAAAREAGRYYSALIDRDRPGDFNQALMDLGAGVCLSNGAALCRECPWQQYCMALRHQTTGQFPVPSVKKPRRTERRTVLLLQMAGKVALRRRPSKGLLPGLYEFPNTGGWLSEEQVRQYIRSLGVESGSVCGGIHRLPGGRHVFSHIEWQMIGFSAVIVESGGQEQAGNAKPEGRNLPDPDEEEGSDAGTEAGSRDDPGKEKEVRAGAEFAPADAEDGGLIWANLRELQTVYSIPSAFETYRKEAERFLRGPALTENDEK